jgi:uncharacterized repeat protein (TIGR03803 family)
MTILLRAKGWMLRVTLLAVTSVLPTLRPAHAQTYTILYTFKGEQDGAGPTGGLLRDAQGNLYGTTFQGGRYSYRGTAFKLSALHKLAVLYSFLDGYGANPFAGLVEGEHGAFYGTTLYGGAYGLGTVFALDKNGYERALHSFSGNSGDGEYPEAGLVLDGAGNVYGTTLYAGLAGCGNGEGCGMVFKLSKTGEETVLHTFTGGTDGGWPLARLVRDKAGNLYGTASGGGDPSCYDGYGCGTVFRLDLAGTFTVLYTFTGTGGDGSGPEAGLILDEAGNLYGTTQVGGSAGFGTVFKVDPAGKETVLYSFLGAPDDGANPSFANLSRDSAGNLYGVTPGGGTACNQDQYGCGIVFSLDPAGKEAVLHYFTGTAGDGAVPDGGLVRDGAGNLYGTTEEGGDTSCSQGAYGCGVVFKLMP